MAELIQRPRYFDRQVLIEDDFKLAQSYDLTRRRLHNRLLHTWGIARGLTLSSVAGASIATVSAGEAIDGQGREIVLATAAQTPDVSSFAGKTLFVTVAYRELETDPRTARGVTGNARYTESPQIAVSEAAPANPADALILGRLVVGADGKIASRDDGVDPNRRRLASSLVRGGAILNSIAIGMDAPGLDYQFEYETVGIANPGHNLRLQSPNSIFLHTGPSRAPQVSVRETGFVGIGTTQPAARLHVQGGAWDVTGSEGDVKVGDATYRLKIGVATVGSGAGDVRVRAHGGTNRLFLGSGTTDTLCVSGARVGLGTIAPDAPLHVVGGNWDLANTEGDVKLGDATNRLKIGIALGGGGAGLAAIRVFGTWGGTGGLTLGCGMNNNLFITGNRIDVNGDLTVNGRLVAPLKTGFVVDQFINTLGEALEQGDVVIIGEKQPELFYGEGDIVPIPEVDLAHDVYDSRVCGVVAEVLGEVDDDGKRTRLLAPQELAYGDRTRVGPRQIGGMVTLGAFGYCKVDADIAPVVAGDLLTTSPTRGHAQKVLERERATGAILAKALGSLAKGKGKIPVLVMLQ